MGVGDSTENLSVFEEIFHQTLTKSTVSFRVTLSLPSRLYVREPVRSFYYYLYSVENFHRCT